MNMTSFRSFWTMSIEPKFSCGLLIILTKLGILQDNLSDTLLIWSSKVVWFKPMCSHCGCACGPRIHGSHIDWRKNIGKLLYHVQRQSSEYVPLQLEIQFLIFNILLIFLIAKVKICCIHQVYCPPPPPLNPAAASPCLLHNKMEDVMVNFKSMKPHWNDFKLWWTLVLYVNLHIHN